MTEDGLPGSHVDAGLLDTSVFIAVESNRPVGALPLQAAVSVVTIAELQLGVLTAEALEIRGRRLATLTSVEAKFEPIGIDSEVARVFAEIVARARQEGRRPKIMDVWIAATAVAYDLPVYTQDADFESMLGVKVIRV